MRRRALGGARGALPSAIPLPAAAAAARPQLATAAAGPLRPLPAGATA